MTEVAQITSKQISDTINAGEVSIEKISKSVKLKNRYLKPKNR